MTNKCILLITISFFVGTLFVGVIGKLYVDNLHHVACKMYNSVDNKSNFGYVNTQFNCGK
jgi:hypothetical protein